MNISKPFASLSPSLLARKGAARPAMRPQLQPIRQFHEATARQMDDLGWNDMGHDEDETPEAEFTKAEPQAERREAEIVPLNLPEPALQPEVTLASPAEPAVQIPAPAIPEVVRQQDVIAARFGGPQKDRRSALADGRRAAFTLRLDSERHLKLRLACTVTNRSAQQIVTEALDRLIADQPEIAALAEQIRKRG